MEILSFQKLQTNIPQMFGELCGVCLGKMTSTCYLVETEEGKALVCAKCFRVPSAAEEVSA